MVAADERDLVLLRRARAGHRGSLDSLAARVGKRVYAHVNRVTLDEELAQDLTQETLLEVHRSLGRLREEDRFWVWVFRIASNKTRQHFRLESRRRVVPMSAVVETEVGDRSIGRAEGLERLYRAELADAMRAALQQLPNRCRMVLVLRFFQDLNHAQIARRLGSTEIGARVALFRAKRKLRTALERRGIATTEAVGRAAVTFP